MTDILPTHYSEPEGYSASTRPDGAQGGNTITCSICQAVYTPAQIYAYLLQAPRVALESAFMSMCHFCFRCRRPACPSCWDYVHGVCGVCALEARLPFRSPGTPLRGVLFPSIRQTQLRHKRAPQTRLTCIQPGKFQNAAPLDSAETMLIETATPEHVSPQALATASDTKTTRQPKRISPSTAQPITPPTRVNIDEIVTKPEPRNTTDEIVTRPEPRNTTNIDEVATKPEPHHAVDIDEIVTKPGPRNSIGRRIERVIISILLILLLFIGALIVLAVLFQNANTIILKITHIDIRVEVAYILQLIKQVFS